MFKLPNIIINIDKLIVHMLMPSQEAPAGNGDLGVILERMDIMSKEFDDELANLATELQENTDATNAVTTLIDKLLADMRDNANNPAKIRELADGFSAQTDMLVAKALENTPADPDAPVE